MSIKTLGVDLGKLSCHVIENQCQVLPRAPVKSEVADEKRKV